MPASPVDDITLFRTLATLVQARLIHRVLGIVRVWRFGAERMLKVSVGTKVYGRHFLLHGQRAGCISRRPTAARFGDPA